MRDKRMLRAGATGALGVSMCFCGVYASPNQASTASIHTATKNKSELRIQPLGANQMQAADALGLTTTPQITPWEQITVHRGDSLSGIFARAGLAASQWRALLKLDPAQSLATLHPGDKLNIRKTPTGDLAELRYRLGSIKTLHINRDGERFQAKIDRLETQTRQITASGTVGRSLSRSMSASGVPANVSAQITKIYRYRHDLRSLHPGDEFSVVYRATYNQGQRIAVGPVLAASITTNNRNYKAFRAKNETNNQYAYYDTAGRPYKPEFTRKPVAYTRISSRFNLHRLNPVTHRVRPHKGVDMAAPTGTPIHAAANGTVKYASWMRGYGRLVELTNFDGYSTRYGHMHRIRSGLNVGEHVNKGDIIGYVGQTGIATGPHLHFEIRRNGVAYNPLTIKLPGGKPLAEKQMLAYKQKIQPLVAKLSPAPTTLLAKTASTPSYSNRCARNVSLDTTLAVDPIGAARRSRSSSILCVVQHGPTNV